MNYEDIPRKKLSYWFNILSMHIHTFNTFNIFAINILQYITIIRV